MRRTIMLGTVFAVAALFAASCSGPTAGAKQSGRDRAVLADGVAFTATTNPFVKTSSVYFPNSLAPLNTSDPAGIWAPTPQGNKLLLVTSSDLKTTVPQNYYPSDPDDKNYYPMDNTMLLVLDPNNTGNNTWRTFGAIASELDIPWTDHVNVQHHMWAPDIDYVGTKYFVFAPARVAPTKNQRIAVFTRNTDPFGKFAYTDYVHITPFGGSGEQYAYDPGVFHVRQGTSVSDYYIAFCDGEYGSGRIEIARFTNAGLTQTTNFGRVKIRNLPVNSKGLTDYYMEGPDLIQIDGVQDRQNPVVILQFAAKFEEDQQEYIGYAYQALSTFESDPANNWNFGGWIQKQIDPTPGVVPSSETAEWTNHATIVPVQPASGPKKYYYLYQYSDGDAAATDGQMRQASMRELHINPADLTIQGAFSNTFSAQWAYLDHAAYPVDGVQYTGQTALLSKGATNNLAVNFFINNPTETAATGWSFVYWLRSENGGAPLIDSPNPSGFTYTARKFGADVWALQFESTSTLNGRSSNINRGQVPSSGPGIGFSLHYTGFAAVNPSNDFSVPNAYGFTDTDTVPIFGVNGKIAGKSPHLKIRSLASSTVITGKNLTASTEVVNGDNLLVGMNDTAWNTQQWELEPVPGTPYVRIKDTAWGLYLNTTTQNEHEKVTLHALDSSWWAEQWLIGTDGTIQNRWTGKYLTLGDPAMDTSNPKHDRNDYVTVWSQALNPAWDTQKWAITYDTW